MKKDTPTADQIQGLTEALTAATPKKPVKKKGKGRLNEVVSIAVAVSACCIALMQVLQIYQQSDMRAHVQQISTLQDGMAQGVTNLLDFTKHSPPKSPELFTEPGLNPREMASECFTFFEHELDIKASKFKKHVFGEVGKREEKSNGS